MNNNKYVIVAKFSKVVGESIDIIPIISMVRGTTILCEQMRRKSLLVTVVQVWM